MARNAEKANAMLNRFYQAKKDATAPIVERRPFRATDVTDVSTAEKWRNAVIRDIGRGVAEIQNATLGEHRIRELNDQLNKWIREKKHWETQIKTLGGPNYAAIAPKLVDADGRGALGSGGYFYFGAAKDLPGVRELFEKQQVEAIKKQRGELYQKIDADYYGYRDDDDGILEKLEKKQQEKLVAASIAAYNSTHSATVTDDQMDVDSSSATASSHKSHVELPSQEEIERVILEKKKADILAKYANM